jgi:uncharacterized membrane protein YuzA (DUF378 family)
MRSANAQFVSYIAAVLTIVGAVAGALVGFVTWDTALLSIRAAVGVLGTHPNLPTEQ